MRSDALGFFWEDRPPEPKQKKEKVKKNPPEPVWLKDDYLPYLDEALRFDAPIMTFEDLQNSIINRDSFVFDIECSPNYFLASFKSVQTGKVIFTEAYNDHTQLNIPLLSWIMQSVELVTFNGLGYDIIVAQVALAGFDLTALKRASDLIIQEGYRAKDIFKFFGIKKRYNFNHIDLMEVAPGRANLKIYCGRIHGKKIQDLPFHHNKILTPQQAMIVRWYNVDGDLNATLDLYNALKEELELRVSLSHEIGIDVRSKSDPQVAETYIGSKLSAMLKKYLRAPEIPEGTVYNYTPPHFVKFKTPLMQKALEIISSAEFKIGFDGKIINPFGEDGLNVTLGSSSYRIKIGGLHSCEKSKTHRSTETRKLYDTDVVSYYPMIILICGLFPKHLTRAFLNVFSAIVDRRIKAKESKMVKVANSLKILINGMFGKLSEPHSIFYAPDLLIQVTLTGQLLLLMLIESLELAGINVVSGNTDGIVTAVDDKDRSLFKQIVADWEMQTGFKTEEAEYKSLHSMDVNNYFAIKKDSSVKSKGRIANHWAANSKTSNFRLTKNPVTTICMDAIEAFFDKGTPLITTIKGCQDITKFVVLRTVKGGSVKIWEDKRVEFIGKSVRWYYATGVTGEIVAANSGNKVPRSDGARPLMVLPESFPDDVDYDWYLNECESILTAVGYGSQVA